MTGRLLVAVLAALLLPVVSAGQQQGQPEPSHSNVTVPVLTDDLIYYPIGGLCKKCEKDGTLEKWQTDDGSDYYVVPFLRFVGAEKCPGAVVDFTVLGDDGLERTHQHDLSATIVYYECKQGHSVEQKQFCSCWCGWSGDPER